MPTNFWIPDYQVLFLGKYQHHSLCKQTQIPEKKSQKQKIKKKCDNTNNQLRHIALKGLPIMLKPNKNFEHFPCHIVPLFKLPVKKKLTLKLWLEERGERCGLFCSPWSYPIWGHALNNFVADWKTLINLATLKSFTYQKRSNKMLLHQRANHADHKQ